MDSRSLDEFQYELGDARPDLFNFITVKFKGYKTYLTSPIIGKFKDTQSFTFKCIKNPESLQNAKKRSILSPGIKLQKKLTTLIQDPNVELVIIPFILKNKLNCKLINRSAHVNLLIYNKHTHELERVDIRKYHVDGFSLKLFIKNINNIFLKDFLHKIDPQAKLAHEIDIPIGFVNKFKDSTAQFLYPLFLLTYLSLRSENPTLTSQSVALKTAHHTDLGEKLWSEFIEFKKQQKSLCDSDLVVNTESLKCLKPTASSIKKYYIKSLVQKLDCPPKKEFDKLRRKCVPKGKILDVNLLYNDVLETSYDQSEILTNLDTDPAIIIATMKFISKKYPQAAILYPKKKSVKTLNKKDIKLMWNANNISRIEVPSHFWKSWKDAQFDPSIRFIVCFIGLKPEKSPGAHANLLFYDKNTNEIERFDGLGAHVSKKYRMNDFDERMKELLNEQTDIFKQPPKYFNPIDFCPAKRAIFQTKEIDEIPGADLTGNCAVWRLWYIHIRLSNPHLNRKQLIELADLKLKDTGNLHKYIKSYQKYILKNIKLKK